MQCRIFLIFPVLILSTFVLFTGCGQPSEYYNILKSSNAYDVNTSKISAKLKITAISPGYWTATYGDFVISYINKDLPWGVQVYFHFGFKEKILSNHNGTSEGAIKDWQNPQTIQTKAVAPYTWDIYINERLYGRGDSVMKTALQFVYKIVLPNNKVIYDKGSQSNWGYYEIPTEEYISSPCSNPDDDGYCEGRINIIEKWEKFSH